MALDPSIPLSVKPLTFNLGELMTQAVDRQAQEQQMAASKQAMDRQRRADAHADEVQQASERAEFLERHLRAAKADPANFPKYKQAVGSRFPEVAEAMGDGDPQALDGLYNSVLTHAQFLENQKQTVAEGRLAVDQGELAIKQQPKPNKFGSSPLGIFNESTGEVTTPAPERPTPPKPNPTEASLAFDAAGGDPTSALRILRQQHPPSSMAVAGADQLTPEAVDYAAAQYRILGSKGMPTRLNEADKRRVINATAEQIKALGQSPVAAIQKQAAYTADAASLKKMTQMSAAAESFENKALGQADIVKEMSDKVPRSQWPILNSAILSGKINLLGDKDAQLLANAVSTFTAEYAKIMEGSTGAAAGSSDAARRAADRLLAAKMNKGTVADTLDLMRREMRLAIGGYGATIDHITERMGGTPAVPAAPTAAPTSGAPLSYQDYLARQKK